MTSQLPEAAMHPLFETMLLHLGLIVALFTAVWVVATIRRDAGLIDLFWGLGFVVVSAVSLTLHRPATTRSWLLFALTAVWGLRLSAYLLWRNWGREEDRRYAAMRQRHGSRFWLVSLFTVFLLQALILWWVSLPLQVAGLSTVGEGRYGSDPPTAPLGVLDALGVVVWLIGFICETVGDWQLARFKSNPDHAGRVMQQGLWRYTRHPNYFGDFCVWWGLYLVAAAGGAAWTIGSPLLMSFLLLKVSGVALLESTIVERRPEYADYQARTNAFFPGPPRPVRKSNAGPTSSID